MKKVIFYTLVLTLFGFSQTFAQSTSELNLNNAIQSTENIQQEIFIAKEEVNQLVKELVVLNNPNVPLFETKMTNYLNAVLNNSDDVQYFIGLAHATSSVPFDSNTIIAGANELVNQNDIIMELAAQTVSAVNAHNHSLALTHLQSIRSTLTIQTNIAQDMISTIETLKNSLRTYTVCIKLVDHQGNPTSYNAGFYAINTSTGQVFYTGRPNDQDYGYGDCFYDLAPGTYQFSSYQDYFCGTNSSTVTLSQNAANNNGIIEVTLVVWCE